MAESGFRLTDSFREAVVLINAIAAGKYRLLLERLLSKLHTRAERAFTDAEESKLMAMLSVTRPQLDTILEASGFIFQQAAYQSVEPERLAELLGEMGVAQANAAAASSVWAAKGAAFVRKLKEASLGGPKVLAATDWHMHLMMSEAGLARLKDPSAVFELTLERPDKPDGEQERIGVEFSHGELYDLFGKLETIQEQLDALGAK